MRKQEKQYEIDNYDKLAEHGHYNTMTEGYKSYLKDAVEQAAPEVRTKSLALLEIGCGSGAYGRFFQTINPRLKITGVDISPKMIEMINAEKMPGYKGVCGDIEDPALFAAGSFDVVLCPGIIHHLPDPAKVFENIALWLKKDGVVILSEPNGSNPTFVISRFLRRMTILFRGKRRIIELGWGTPNETFHKVRRYRKWLAANGLDDYRFFKTTDAIIRKDGKIGLADRIRLAISAVASIFSRWAKGYTLIVVTRKR